MSEIRNKRRQWHRLVAWPLAAGMLGVGVLAIWVATAGGDAAQSVVVREVSTMRYNTAKSSNVLVEDTWTLLGPSGEPEAFVGNYYELDGTLHQAQYRDASSELTYWASYEGSERAGSACVEHAPPHPNGLTGLLPFALDPDELAARGYAPGGEAGESALPAPGDAVPANPQSTRSFDLADTTIWFETLEHESVTAERTLAVADDGTVVGFWSVRRDDSGADIASNSDVASLVETYDADVFDRVMEGTPFDETPSCN